MSIESIELHDGLFEFSEIDYANRTVRIRISFYETENAKSRVPLRIVFRNVDSLSQISDFKNMAKNAFAGNINYWAIGDDETPTYLYFTDGCLVIRADRPEIERAE